VADDLFDGPAISAHVAAFPERRLAHFTARAAFQAELATFQIRHAAIGQHDQHLPQIAAIGHLGERTPANLPFVVRIIEVGRVLWKEPANAIQQGFLRRRHRATAGDRQPLQGIEWTAKQRNGFQDRGLARVVRSDEQIHIGQLRQIEVTKAPQGMDRQLVNMVWLDGPGKQGRAWGNVVSIPPDVPRVAIRAAGVDPVGQFLGSPEQGPTDANRLGNVTGRIPVPPGAFGDAAQGGGFDGGQQEGRAV
jgi:hypothetical protein